MNTKLFRDWYEAVRPGRKGQALYPFLEQYPEADEILKEALGDEKNPKGVDWVISQMKEAGALVPLPSAESQVSSSAQPSPKTSIPPTTANKPRFLDRFRSAKAPSDDSEAPKKGMSRTVKIVIVVVLAVALLAGGYFMFGRGGSSSYDFSAPSYAESGPAPTSDPALGSAPQTPGEAVPTQKSEPNRWQQFVALNRNSDANGPFLDKPAVWQDILKHFPTRWFLWIAFLYPIWTLLKQDRLAAEERTDVKAAKRGLTALFVGVLLAGLLSASTSYLAVLILGTSIEIPKYFFISMGVVVNLFVQWTAAMNGRKDYSTFSIGGLFFTGALLIWWFTPNLPLIVLGSLFMAGGIWLQNVEMRRTHQGWAAHLTTLAMLLMFAGITALIYFALGFIPPITGAMPWIQQFAFAVIYSGRLFIGAIIGLLTAFAGGDYISTTFMLPSIAGGVSLAGGNKADDDVSHKFDVNSRFDAMAFAIMILYPIAVVAWYAVALL